MIEFFNYLNSLHPLSAEATAALMKVIRVKELRRGQVWLQEGAVCDKMTFVVKGLMKLYFEVGSKEVVLNFARENEFMVSAQSYFNRAASDYSIRCIEQTVVAYILCNDWYHILEKHSELNKHYLLIAKECLSSMENHTALLLMPPKARYEILVADNSWMIEGRLTDRMIAGYLGIGWNGLGRWRK